MFIETEDGTWINLNLVRHIQSEGSNRFRVAFSEEHFLTKEIRHGDLEDFINQAAWVPASPNFYKLSFFYGGGEAHYETQPIVGWMRDCGAGADPIVVDGGWCNEWAVLFPDKTVLDKGNEEIFDTVGEWAEALCKRHGAKLVSRDRETASLKKAA